MMMMMMMMMGLPVDSGWVSKLATNTLKSRFHRRFLRRALRILTTPEQCTRGNQISPKSENRIGWTSRRRIVSAEHHLNTRCTLMTIVPVTLNVVLMTILKPVCSHTSITKVGSGNLTRYHIVMADLGTKRLSNFGQRHVCWNLVLAGLARQQRLMKLCVNYIICM